MTTPTHSRWDIARQIAQREENLLERKKHLVLQKQKILREMYEQTALNVLTKLCADTRTQLEALANQFANFQKGHCVSIEERKKIEAEIVTYANQIDFARVYANLFLRASAGRYKFACLITQLTATKLLFEDSLQAVEAISKDHSSEQGQLKSLAAKIDSYIQHSTEELKKNNLLPQTSQVSNSIFQSHSDSI